MEPFEFLHLNPGKFSCGPPSAVELLEIKNVTYGTGHIQFFGVDNLFHSSGFGDVSN
jgi:hypothetical protein